VDIGPWLHGLGLQQYEQAFRDNAIDAAILPELTADDLRDIGVNLVGHRRKLLAAISALRSGPAPDSVARAPSVERRQLTVMFCDLVGSTALSVRRDPEDLRDLIAAYHRAVADVVKRFEGFVARYMGDGILIYFGYPRAHEDDAEQAARCALAVVEAVSGLKLAEELRARIGIATGMVVVGGGAPEHDVVGETPNLAARLQSLAEPNSVLIDENTRRLIGGLFEYRDLGAVEARGFTGTISAWQVLRPSALASRFEALRASSPTPLIGRGEEFEFLLRRWEQARKADGRVVLLSGEPGIGKSRMTAALGERLHEEPHYHLRYFCAPPHQDTALYPVITHLEHAAGFARDDSPTAKLEKLRQLFGQGRLGHLRRRVAAHAGQRSRNSEQETELLLLAVAGVRQALVADLLSLPTAGALPEMNLSPQRKKEKTLEALLGLLEDQSRKRPVLMVFEDVHWIDPTSRELLDLTIERIRRLPILLIITFRPEFQEAWSGAAHVSTLLLNRLDAGEVTVLAETVAGKALPNEVVTHIAVRTDGVPLFVEELTRAVVESGLLSDEGNRYALNQPIPLLAIPPSLHASLLARLDRLGPAAKEIAQIGAAIGRDFPYELLAAVAQRSEAELHDALSRLVDAGLVFQRGVPTDATFLFKHALVQDMAYATLLRGGRRALHTRIAHVIEEQFSTLAETQPGILAHHFTEGGLLQKAVVYWCRAGQQSAANSALTEAIGQVRRGLQLIADLPDTPERKQQELDLQVTLAGALLGMKGYAHPEAFEVLNRARDLIAETDTAGSTVHFSVLYGLFLTNRAGGNARLALERAREFLSLAQSQTDTGLLLMGNRLTGVSLIDMGDFPLAFSHLKRAVALYVPEEHRSLATWFGGDIGVVALAQWARTLWHRGHPDQASKTADKALRHARQRVHPLTLAHALLHLILTSVYARQAREADERANELVAISNEHRFAAFLGWGLIFQGWALALGGQTKVAVERIRDGITATRSTGARWDEPLFLGLLAEALALAGAVEEGLEALAEALAIAESSGARGNDAELHRSRGDLLQRLPSPDWTEVEASFHASLALARNQGTRGFELRAAASLARLWRDQGKLADARDLLAPVYGWFTEGFGTPDLKEARALLGELDA
jgi:class 3 adenylate cyclase/predicted ATPase